MNTNNNNTDEFNEEETFIFEYDHDNFLETYQIAENNYIDYEVDEEYDTEAAHVANEIEIIDSVASSNKLEDENYTIPQETQGKLTACCIMDYENKSFQKCGSEKKLQKLSQLIGIWKLDKEVINSVEKDFSRLGICMLHFNYNQ
ncbi:2255_t:CDS:1 [Diversispora eburnea]|uniref:2255_t:CDS:1 n=1 Tax=Diversispora eburnea TaxID=1213867 RepID=A0A9N9G5F9_9GLOM|nr:2255_t:CDS:1 [Diversispora eburnea]